MSSSPPDDLFKPVYVTRTEPMIAIQRSELRMVSSLNTIATFCFSMANGLLFSGLGILWDALTDDQITRNEQPWLIWSLVGILVFVGAGVWAVRRRRTDFIDIWTRIEE